MNRLTIKLAGKVALLFRENVVTPEAATPMQDPLNDAACRLVEGLEGKPGSVDSTAAAAAIEAAGGACVSGAAACTLHARCGTWPARRVVHAPLLLLARWPLQLPFSQWFGRT